MKPERILLPLDIRKCPLEIFSLIRAFSTRPEVTLILLHVLHVSIDTSDERVSAELAHQAKQYLRRLAQQFLHPTCSTMVHIRIGKTAEQILEEAKAEAVQLIILPTPKPSFWTRLVSMVKPGVCRIISPIVEEIIRDSTCGVFVASVATRFNCPKQWGRRTERKYLPFFNKPTKSGLVSLGE